MEETTKRGYRKLMETDLSKDFKKVLQKKLCDKLKEFIFEPNPEKEYEWYMTHSDGIEAILIMVQREINYYDDVIKSLVELNNIWLNYSISIKEHSQRLWALVEIRNRIEDAFYCED